VAVVANAAIQIWRTGQQPTKFKSATRRRRRLEANAVSHAGLVEFAHEKLVIIRVLLSVEEHQTLNDALGRTGIHSYELKRVDPWWYVRIENQQSAELLSMLTGADIRHELITEHEFWCSRSTSF